MDTTNSSTNGTSMGSISISSRLLNGFILKFLVFLLSSSVFWVAISMAVLIHFIFRYVFRPRKQEPIPTFYPEVETSMDKDRFTGFDYIWEHNHDIIWNNNADNHSVSDPKCVDESVKFNFIQGEQPENSEDSEILTSNLSFKFEYPKPEGFDEHKVHEVKEEESPAFSQSPISDVPQVTNELPVSTSIQKYQFVPDRNLRAFIEQPETMTISVKEFCTELKTEKLASKEDEVYLNLEGQMMVETEKPQPEIEPELKSDVILEPEFESELRIEPESHPESEVGADLKPEFLPDLKPECEPAPILDHKPESKSELEPEPEPLYGTKRDIEVKSERCFTAVSHREPPSEDKPEYTNYKETHPAADSSTNILSLNDAAIISSMHDISDRGTFNPVNEPAELNNIPSEPEIPLEKPKRHSRKPTHGSSKKKLVRRKRSIQKEVFLEEPKSSTSSSSPSTVSSKRGGRTQTRRYVSEEFSGFNSDSQSSVSDGYSVKDLAVDSDSDWFLSEKESDNYQHKAYTSEESTNLTSYTVKLMDHTKELKKGQVQPFFCSETDSNGYMVQNAYIHRQPDEVNVWLENSSKANFDGLQQEAAEKEVKNESERNNFQEHEGQETNMESNRSLDLVVTTNEDLSKETRTSFVSQKDVKTSENLDRETHMAPLEQDETKPPVKDSVAEKATEEPEKIDRQAIKSKDKGKEYLDEEEEDELESLWEHQDLIEQLKMEIKKARAIGLPTILEESESPKTTIEDLKPWQFDEKFLREDPMDELNKFYKTYRERMRKFDILNYQKMYAVGFLQLKDPLESMGSQKPLLPTITSILSQNLYRHRKSIDDPSELFIRELRCDLEMVYVGQMCLSWEFLRWQYEKAREMPESDPYRSHRYNQAAVEFQQFQVLINRFVENEPFQVPRLPNYVKNRCVLRNLLQVPIIKEDNLKEKMEDDRKGNYIVTSEELEDIMEESIRVFWEFVKAEKDETPVILKGLVGPQVELQDPSDYDFMMHLHSLLQKKLKRLKDLLKTGNCLVKKFKKPKEDRSNQDLFFSQVDLKLVSRVLKMPKITSEQLHWCHRKLDKISFVDRKIQRESSFLLFPC